MLARSEVICSIPPSAAWKARLFCVSWPPTLPSVLTIIMRAIAIPVMMTNSIMDAIRVNPREPRFVLCIVSLLISSPNSSCVSISNFWPARSIGQVVTILIAQVSGADRSLRVESLVAVGRLQSLTHSSELAANRQMDHIDLANQVEGCAQRISAIAQSVEESASRAVSVVSKLHVDDVLANRYWSLPIDLPHQGRCSGPDAERIRQHP